MLETVSPDGVIIATPNALHVPIGKVCAESGVHILVEKPIADTVGSARELTVAAKRSEIKLLIGHFRRYNPVIQKARRIVRDVQIGRLTAVNGSCLFRKPDRYFDTNWRVSHGGGPILINIVYDIDALRFICSGIIGVQAVAAHQARQLSVEDKAAALIQFDNGALGCMILSDATVSPWAWNLNFR